MNLKRPLLALYIFALLIFIIHFIIIGKALYGDGRYYYSYLPALFTDHSLNFSNSFKYLGISSFLTPLGFPANIYPIGPAIFWLIPFSLAHFILMPFGLNNGFNNFYQIFIGIWNISFVFFGLYLLKKCLDNFFSKKISILSTIALFLTTNLLFYGSLDVINSHSASFFLSSAFLYIYLKQKTIKSSILLGIILGFLTLVRPQDIIFIIFPLSTLILNRKKYIFNFLIILFFAFIIFFPQLLVWKILWGTWYKNPYLFVETFNFLSPNILGVLFNKSSGLLLWTPIITICLYGIILFANKKQLIGIPIMLLFFIQLYIVSSWSIWWQGASYSGRMFVSSLPILSFGLAYFLSKKQLITSYFIVSLLSILNILLVILFLLNN